MVDQEYELDFDAIAEGLDLPRETLPKEPRKPDEPVAGKTIQPDWSPVTDYEWDRIEGAIPARAAPGGLRSPLTNREYIDYTLYAASKRFAWSDLKVDPRWPAEAIRAKVTRWAVHQAGNVWRFIFEVVSEGAAPERAEAFRILAERADKERARIYEARTRRLRQRSL